MKSFWVLACAACTSPLHAPAFAPQPTAALEEVPSAPPPARVEQIPASPRRDAVWIDGEWTWRHKRWSWIRGRWVLPPKAAKFSPWVLVRGSDGTLYEAHGVWRDARGTPLDPPKELAAADVSDTAIVDAYGNTSEPGRVIDTKATDEDAR